MPRTSFGPGPSLPKDSQDLRETAEEKHRRQQEWAFLFPLMISAEARGATTEGHDSNTIWRWNHHYFIDVKYEKRLDELPAEVYRRFCFKDCALYGVSAGFGQELLRRHLFDRIYRRWFPTRAEDVDISHGAFFCQYIGMKGMSLPDTHVPTIAEVLTFHKDLCSRAKQAIPKMGLPEPFTVGPFAPTEEHSLLSPRAVYKLRPSFERCFIYLHAENTDHSIDSLVMKERGLRVVFLQEAHAVEHGCTEHADQGITRMREEEQGLGGAAVFRCDTIERAIRVVLSINSERVEARQERHGYYGDEFLDSSPATLIPAQPCMCIRCQEAEKQHHA